MILQDFKFDSKLKLNSVNGKQIPKIQDSDLWYLSNTKLRKWEIILITIGLLAYFNQFW